MDASQEPSHFGHLKRIFSLPKAAHLKRWLKNKELIMIDKYEKDLHDHADCDCNDENCECESDIITLDMEDGTQKDFQVLEVIEFEGSQYIALAEVDSNEYDILRMEVDGDTVELAVIDDEDLFVKVSQKFDELFGAEEDEEDTEDEEDKA